MECGHFWTRCIPCDDGGGPNKPHSNMCHSPMEEVRTFGNLAGLIARSLLPLDRIPIEETHGGRSKLVVPSSLFAIKTYAGKTRGEVFITSANRGVHQKVNMDRCYMAHGWGPVEKQREAVFKFLQCWHVAAWQGLVEEWRKRSQWRAPSRHVAAVDEAHKKGFQNIQIDVVRAGT